MLNVSDITVAILAGGKGTRLSSVMPDQQKVVSKVKEHPFLEYILSQLDKAGFKDVVICTGYLGDQVEIAFGDNYQNLSLSYSREVSALGTAGSLRKAFPLLNSETVLVMNGDSFCEVGFKRFWQFHLDKNSNASLVLTSVSDTSSYGKVELSNDNSIISFQEKKAGSGAGLINAGIYLINKSLFAEIPENKEISIEKEVFPKWIGRGFYGYRGSNNFIDIGKPENYAKAEEFFAKYNL